MKKDLIKSIQTQLQKLTNKRFSKKYVENFIYPILIHINLSKNHKFLICGAQGVGKSTLLQILEKHLLVFFKKKTLNLSLDNYYLTKKQRVCLSKTKHPLLLTRGVPGTHDSQLLLKNIIEFEKSRYPIKIPIFNKLKDDRSKYLKLLNSDYDILILEGWCCGCPPVDSKFLFKNINSLESNKDKKRIWRKFYNQKLKKEYSKIFNRFDEIIFLKTPLFSNIITWRLKQEKMMKKQSNFKKSMSKVQIEEFVQYYEKLTKWMIKVLPPISNLTIHIGKDQKIKKILKN